MTWIIALTLLLIFFGVFLVLAISWFFRKFVADLDEEAGGVNGANPDTFVLIHTAKFEDYDFFDNITDV